MSYTCSNGYTKATIIAKIRLGNNGTRAVDNGGCVYLTDGGNKCGIGCFIPDGHAAQGITCSVKDLLRTYPDLLAYMPLAELEGLQEMQRAHDSCLDADPRDVLEDWINDNVQD